MSEEVIYVDDLKDVECFREQFYSKDAYRKCLNEAYIKIRLFNKEYDYGFVFERVDPKRFHDTFVTWQACMICETQESLLDDGYVKMDNGCKLVYTNFSDEDI